MNTSSTEVLDLFAGSGGLSIGFKDKGFSVTGVDIEKRTKEIFSLNNIGEALTKNLLEEMVIEDVPVVIGSPPCRPWSSVNITRREDHPDKPLLGRFFEHIAEIKPNVFLMENVLPVKSDDAYKKWVALLQKEGYSIEPRIISYGDFGAPTARRRLFTLGFKDSGAGLETFFNKLDKHKKKPSTVRKAIFWLKNKEMGEYPDHVWLVFKTIEKYKKYYETGKYGWYKLNYDEPAPSFGNITKTYILHPEAGNNGTPLRVLSVREALSIMGFGKKFRFPEDMGVKLRYQMAADVVSPVFSKVCAKIIKEMLEGND